MPLSPEKLKEIFVAPGHVSEADFLSAKKRAETEGVALERILVEQGFVRDEHAGRSIADALDLRFLDISDTLLSPETLLLIPESVARQQETILLSRDKGHIKIATARPDNYEFIKLVEKRFRRPVEIYYATSLGIREALKYYKSDLAGRVAKLIGVFESEPENEEVPVKLVDLLLEEAYDERASDIHFEPRETSTDVRFRIDGVLHKVADYPISLHEKVVFRIKILARLRTDEHEAAQDGRFTYSARRGASGELLPEEDEKSFHERRLEGLFDVRVSVLPVTEGENIVLRLLAERSRRLNLEELGLLPKDLEKVKRAAAKPYGMILAVGPTGSGKTTTLYALLQLLNTPDVNIMTIEDPVEYHIEGVHQTQVNQKKNLTFATGLRSIVRQDPDIIMVGEIRDSDTADIAVNAAMTGHLLFSSLHANDAATAFPRLIEMGIEPFLAASSVNVIIAQRLVRKICSACRMSVVLSKEETEVLKADPILVALVRELGGTGDFSALRFYKGKGCPVCAHTGYSERTGIFEVMEVTKEFLPLITAKSPSSDIEAKAKEMGMTVMLFDGLTKVFNGITTLEEVLRTVRA
jgi:type IV pilus assembly protein PilB